MRSGGLSTMFTSLKTAFRGDADATLARYERALTRERVLRDAASGSTRESA